MSLTRITNRITRSYNKIACIHTLCLTVSELIVGQASKYNACAMNMIWDELGSNSIEIDREILSFHIHACLREYEGLYGTVIIRLDKDNLLNSLCDIYEEMCPNNFGRLIAYLTLVYQVADSCKEEIIREAVQGTVEDFKYIDLENI